MICKNCGDNTRGRHCHSCGQKTDTHRLTTKHFFTHDLLHGLFHLDRGLPKTLKAILLRPGQVASDYINGKRKSYYNFFYLLLLISALLLFLVSTTKPPEGVVEAKQLMLLKNLKVMVFAYIPLFAIAGFLVYRPLKLNFIEWFIPAVVATIGLCIFNILVIIPAVSVTVFHIEKTPLIFKIYEIVLASIMYLFPLYAYFQFTRSHFSLLETILRLIAFAVIFFLMLQGIMYAILKLI